MEHDDSVYLGHMTDLAEKSVGKIAGISRADFDKDENLRLALTHLLQNIGKAARRVPDEFKARHAGIPWKNIMGLRHKVVHDYMSVDYDIVWDVVSHDLPDLVSKLKSLTKD